MDLTLVLAIWGATLSTVLAAKDLILARKELSKDRPNIKVICKWAYPVPGPDVVLLSISAVNSGRPTTIREAGLLLSDDCRLIQPTAIFGAPRLPQELGTGKELTIYMEHNSVVEQLKKQVAGSGRRLEAAYVRDVEGHTYKTRPPKEFEWAMQGKLPDGTQ